MNKTVYCLLGFLSVSLLLFSDPASAQKRRKKVKEEKEIRIYDVDTLVQRVPKNREIFHLRIDREQSRADLHDGNKDNKIFYSDDTTLTRTLTQAIITDIDQIEVMIENLPLKGDLQTANQTKIRYLTAVWNYVKKYNSDVRVDPYVYRKQTYNLKDLIIARHEDKVNEFAAANANLQTLNNAELLEGYPEAKRIVFTTVGNDNPKYLIRRLSEFAKEPYACDIIASAAKVVPNDVYNYAASTNYTLSNSVKTCQDPLVQSIVKIANESKAPLRALPFLSDIYSKKKTIAEIDRITADADLFYKNLVRLKLENENLGGDTYTQELQYRGLKYVRTMNDLHESSDAVRFKCIDGFTPEELYFIMVYGQDEIYTSSFLGTFKRMMERMAPSKMSGDQLFDKVHYDRFRTFIRMCAGYNTLTPFLASIEEGKKTNLMRDFISGLDKGREDDLEDAVDVADAFGSLEDSSLSVFLQDQVRENYERCKNGNSKKGIIIYGLLSTLFKGGVNGEEVGLPPVTFVPYKNLAGDTGVVFEQFFFYGDEDGKMSYESFLGNFKDGKWKVAKDKYWTTITSTSGKPVVIYANNPLPEPEDEESQKKLADFLNGKNIHPTIIVHRGHSYHLPLTMEGLQKQTKIVMLGSCGGYHNLGTVLDRSPDAQIISTKQTGTMYVNEPIIKDINNQLLEGKDVDWLNSWRTLNAYFASKGGDPLAKFRDYVPPHKNLGAIFIKAYRRLANDEEAM